MNKDMEKLTKKDLLEKLGGTLLSDDDLEQVTGGWTGNYLYCADIVETHAYNLCEDVDGTIVVNDSQGTHTFSGHDDFLHNYKG